MIGSRLSDKVVDFTKENALISLPSSMVVGVSGGADSMALLHLLHSVAFSGLCVYAVHVHHGLRGEEADRDEELVREFCMQHDIPLHVEYADVRRYADEWNCGLEEAGRRVRYDAFERVRAQYGAEYIATAHTADDVTETILMHILRGCGVSGLVGIPAKRGNIVRPMLDCNRVEIEAYCAEQHIPYVVDSTNMDVGFIRNRVRHELLPLMRCVNPAVDVALARLGAAAAQDEQYFLTCALQALDECRIHEGVYTREGFLSQPPSIRVRMCRALFAEYGCYSFTESHINALQIALKNNRGVVSMPNDSRITVSAGQVMRYVKLEQERVEPIAVQSLPCSFQFNNRIYCLEVLSREDILSFQNVHKMFFKFAIDYDKIQGGLTIRCRQEGDYIHLADRQVGKSLKKLFQECHIPAQERAAVPLLCDDVGVLLVRNVGCDSRVCPDDSTKHFLVWTVQDEPSYDE